MSKKQNAASTAIYGARANSGVILVTTKRGKEGKATVSYRFKGGMNFARKGYEFLGARDYLHYNRLGNKYINDAGYTRTLQQVNNSNGYGTNAGKFFSLQYLTDENKHLLSEGWEQMTDPYDGTGQLIFRDYGGQMMNASFNDPSFTQDHYVSVTGGNDKATFITSFGYYDEQGQVVGTSYKRFTGNVNGSYKVRDNIKINAGANYSFSKKHYFHLLRSWGDVIIATEPTITLDVTNLAKAVSPAADVMKLIKDDIEASVKHFGSDYSIKGNKSQWSKAATLMLKAEVYLWSAKQMGGGSADAGTAKSALLDIQQGAKGLGLVDNFTDVFAYKQKGNKEIIFAFRNRSEVRHCQRKYVWSDASGYQEHEPSTF